MLRRQVHFLCIDFHIFCHCKLKSGLAQREIDSCCLMQLVILHQICCMVNWNLQITKQCQSNHSQIVKTEKEIQDAEQQLEALSADSDPTIIEDVRIALAAKRKEEEQLRMKEGQLRTEKQLLRTREDLMLLDERNRNQGEQLPVCHCVNATAGIKNTSQGT